MLESQYQSVSEEDKQKNKIIWKTIQKEIYLRRQTKKEKIHKRIQNKSIQQCVAENIKNTMI